MNARTPRDETVGFYDPAGAPVLFLSNDGRRITAERGPSAGEYLPTRLPPVQAGPVSLARILSGAPGYDVEEGELARTRQGEWVFEDARQRLFSDPSRRVLRRAEYEFAGKRVTVSYPGRSAPGPPPAVSVEVSGAKILLRRDAE